jgi:hypothetical protein
MGRYEAACARREACENEWIALGEPLLTAGSKGQLIEHPLVKMLRDHDVLIDRLAARVKPAHAGPAPSAVIRVSPAAQLRAVK